MAYQLYLGDCLEIMPTLADQSIDAIICDLPYGSTVCSWDVVIPFCDLWPQYQRIIKPKGAIVLFGSQPFTTELIASNRKWFKHSWVWNKGNSGSFANATIAPLRFHEDICIFCCGQPTYNPQYIYAGYENGKRSKKPRNLGMGRKQEYAEDFTYKPDAKLRYPNTILNFGSGNGECNSLHRIHPTQKPLALLEYLVKAITNGRIESSAMLTQAEAKTLIEKLETKIREHYEMASAELVEQQIEQPDVDTNNLFGVELANAYTALCKLLKPQEAPVVVGK